MYCATRCGPSDLRIVEMAISCQKDSQVIPLQRLKFLKAAKQVVFQKGLTETLHK
jgi:hypothetical protein